MTTKMADRIITLLLFLFIAFCLHLCGFKGGNGDFEVGRAGIMDM